MNPQGIPRFLCIIEAFTTTNAYFSIIFHINMLAPPGGFARLGTMSTVTTCAEYLQPFVVLAIMVLILRCFSI